MRLALLAVLASAALAQPNAVDLFLLSAQADKANSEKIREYTYREYKVTQAIDKDGKKTHRQTETWDVIGLEGSTYRKLILRNDQPLEPKEQKREDERLAKETALRRKETPAQRRKRSLSFRFSYSVGRLEPERTVALFDLEFKGEDEVDGRAAYVIEGMPKRGAHPANANEKENLNYRLKMWIDQQDHMTSRSEMEVIGEHSRMQRGTLIESSYARNNMGAWLIKEFRFRFNLRILKMGTARGDMRVTFTDYRRFQVDSRLLEAKP